MSKCLLATHVYSTARWSLYSYGLEIDGPKIFVTCEDDKGVKALTSAFLHQI
jgi:hypothetical protein